MNEILCAAKACDCVCTLPPHQETEPHLCDPATCGGMWIGDYDDPDSFEVVRLPTPGGVL